MVKKKSGSYRRGKLSGPKPKHMKADTERQDLELAALLRLRDEDIDTSDIPEVKDWSKAVVGKFYRPIKEPVTLRLDGDVLARLKAAGPGYQTRINTLLRAVVVDRMDTGALLEHELENAAALAMRDFWFPGLEEHGEVEECNVIAEAIERRHSVFACLG
jgi:uncharacterized protein (DUF4415 family)